MSKPITVVGSTTTGHEDWPPTRVNSGCDWVRVNNKPVARIGDTCDPHTNPSGVTHYPVLSQGSSFVRIDGIPVSYEGAEVADGGCDSSHKIAQGESFVKIPE